MERSRPSESDAPLLEQRAITLARPHEEDSGEDIHAIVVVVRVGAERVGLPAEDLWGLLDGVKMTPVPGAPHWVAGLAQVRGELISVTYFGHWLGMKQAPDSGSVAVLAEPRGLLGILVDEVLGFLDIRTEDLSEALTARARCGDKPFSAVTKSLVAVLDVQRFFSDPRLIVDDRSAPLA